MPAVRLQLMRTPPFLCASGDHQQWPDRRSDSRHGLPCCLLRACDGLPHVQCRGLMTSAMQHECAAYTQFSTWHSARPTRPGLNKMRSTTRGFVEACGMAQLRRMPPTQALSSTHTCPVPVTCTLYVLWAASADEAGEGQRREKEAHALMHTTVCRCKAWENTK